MKYEEAIKKFEPYIDNEAYTDSFQEACRMAIETLEKVADLERRGLTDEVLDNYKTFEDECVAKGFTFKSLIEAREKQTPKKPILGGKYEIEEWECPNCKTYFAQLDDRPRCCCQCGQHIDWSDEE